MFQQTGAVRRTIGQRCTVCNSNKVKHNSTAEHMPAHNSVRLNVLG
jgi:hypothetical protein